MRRGCGRDCRRFSCKRVRSARRGVTLLLLLLEQEAADGERVCRALVGVVWLLAQAAAGE